MTHFFIAQINLADVVLLRNGITSLKDLIEKYELGKDGTNCPGGFIF